MKYGPIIPMLTLLCMLPDRIRQRQFKIYNSMPYDYQTFQDTMLSPICSVTLLDNAVITFDTPAFNGLWYLNRIKEETISSFIDISVEELKIMGIPDYMFNNIGTSVSVGATIGSLITTTLGSSVLGPVGLVAGVIGTLVSIFQAVDSENKKKIMEYNAKISLNLSLALTSQLLLIKDLIQADLVAGNDIYLLEISKILKLESITRVINSISSSERKLEISDYIKVFESYKEIAIAFKEVKQSFGLLNAEIEQAERNKYIKGIPQFVKYFNDVFHNNHLNFEISESEAISLAEVGELIALPICYDTKLRKTTGHSIILPSDDNVYKIEFVQVDNVSEVELRPLYDKIYSYNFISKSYYTVVNETSIVKQKISGISGEVKTRVKGLASARLLYPYQVGIPLYGFSAMKWSVDEILNGVSFQNLHRKYNLAVIDDNNGNRFESPLYLRSDSPFRIVKATRATHKILTSTFLQSYAIDIPRAFTVKVFEQLTHLNKADVLIENLKSKLHLIEFPFFFYSAYVDLEAKKIIFAIELEIINRKGFAIEKDKDYNLSTYREVAQTIKKLVNLQAWYYRMREEEIIKVRKELSTLLPRFEIDISEYASRVSVSGIKRIFSGSGTGVYLSDSHISLTLNCYTIGNIDIVDIRPILDIKQVHGVSSRDVQNNQNTIEDFADLKILYGRNHDFRNKGDSQIVLDGPIPIINDTISKKETDYRNASMVCEVSSFRRREFQLIRR